MNGAEGAVDPAEAGPPSGSIDRFDLMAWLQVRLPRLGEAWSTAIGARSSQGPLVDSVVVRFVHQLVGLLPAMLGPSREQVQPLWVRSSELFGAFAAKRGLAAGEVIEEFQILRELIIRDLYEDPTRRRVRLSLRGILRLNQVIDRGVTHASVGHTDAMFFQFFEPEGQAAMLPVEDLVDETEAQLSLIDGELNEILALGAARRGEPTS